MKTEIYIKPETEVIDICPEGIMAFSSNGNSTDLGEAEDGYTGNSYTRKRNIWEE